MFIGLRDIFFAKGRFALIAAVVALLTLLLVMLTGLTGGLGKQNTAALESLNVDRVVFGSLGSNDPEISFTSSSVNAVEEQQWAEQNGISQVTPLGISQTTAEGPQASAAVAVFGIPAESSLLKQSVGEATSGSASLADNRVVIAESVAQDTGLAAGDSLTLSGNTFEVGGIVDTTYYSHTPVVWASTENWQKIGHIQPATDSRSETVGTVLAVSAPDADDALFNKVADQSRTLAVTTKDSLTGLAAYQSERGSLQAMQGFLYGISALVTLSFLTVWTIQRTRDLAVLRALGGSTGYLLKDALNQAAIILLIGAGTGALLGWGLGALAQNALPFQLDVLTVVAPALGIWVIGLIGALIATSRITKIDPMIALGGN